MCRKKLYFVLFAPVLILLIANCKKNSPSIAAGNGELFSLTNTVMEGGAEGEIVQVLKSTFGLKILPRRSDVHIQFGTNGNLHIFFNETTLKPEATLFETADSDGKPGYDIYDMNADGVPDLRQIHGEKSRQIYYLGKWYECPTEGTNVVITFDGSTWRETPDGAAVPPIKSNYPLTRMQ